VDVANEENYQRSIAVGVENEKDLLLEVAAGNESAFRKLFQVYWKKVYAVSLDFTKSEPLAEEIVQDVFLKIWLKREYLVSVLKFDDYLFTVARNHIYNTLRKKTAEQSFLKHLENHFPGKFKLPGAGYSF
jgi:RNA polymerase sigma-70 factor (ECF subfamily)